MQFGPAGAGPSSPSSSRRYSREQSYHFVAVDWGKDNERLELRNEEGDSGHLY